MKYYFSAFLIGILSALAILILEFSFLAIFYSQSADSSQDFFWPILAAVILEETAKLIILIKLVKNKNPKSFILFSILFGLGIAAAEITINIYNSLSFNGMGLLFPLIYIILIHLITCSVFGYKLSQNIKIFGYITIWIAAIIFHGIFNFLIFQEFMGYQKTDFILAIIFALTLILAKTGILKYNLES